MRKILGEFFLLILVFVQSAGFVEAGPKGYGEGEGPDPSVMSALFGPIKVPRCKDVEDPLIQLGILRRFMNDSDKFDGSGRGRGFQSDDGERVSYLSVDRLTVNLTPRNLHDIERLLPFLHDADPKIRLLVGTVCYRFRGYDALYGLGYGSQLTGDNSETHQEIVDYLNGLIAKKRGN